jgi:hypothetical protein
MQEIMNQKIIEMEALVKEKNKKGDSREEDNRVVFKQTDYSQDKEIEKDNIKKIVEDFKDNESIEEVSFRERTENPSVKSDISSNLNSRNRQANNNERVIYDNDRSGNKNGAYADKRDENKRKYNYDHIEDDQAVVSKHPQKQQVIYKGREEEYNDHYNNRYINDGDSRNENQMGRSNNISQSVNLSGKNPRQQQSYRNEEPVSYINQWYSKHE